MRAWIWVGAGAFLLVAQLLCLDLKVLAAQPEGPPTRALLLEEAKRCRHILKTSLVDFYLPASVDKANGGYFETLRGGKLAPAGEKFLTLQGRHLWFFSTLAARGHRAARQPLARGQGWLRLPANEDARPEERRLSLQRSTDTGQRLGD